MNSMNTFKILLLAAGLSAFPALQAMDPNPNNGEDANSSWTLSGFGRSLASTWGIRHIMDHSYVAGLTACGAGAFLTAHRYSKSFRENVSTKVFGYFDKLGKGDTKTVAITGAGALLVAGIIYRKEVGSALTTGVRVVNPTFKMTKDEREAYHLPKMRELALENAKLKLAVAQADAAKAQKAFGMHVRVCERATDRGNLEASLLATLKLESDKAHVEKIKADVVLETAQVDLETAQHEYDALQPASVD